MMMAGGLQDLTEREKETLRLLLVGHDAKSIAAALGLSVHTIHERLREARRKLDVSSSREAARRLAAAEAATVDPQFLTGQQMGDAMARPKAPSSASPDAPRRGARLVWLSGGMLIMSLLVAALALSPAIMGRAVQPPTLAASVATLPAADAKPALDWIAFVDAGRWDESWTAASGYFRSRITEANWASVIQAARQPLGAVTSRKVLDLKRATNLPGAPAGEYTVVQFQTDFAQKPGMVETITLVREAGSWKAVGYFIR